MMKINIISVLLISLFSGTLTAQKIPSAKPKLIVGITVSGMRYDYLSAFWDSFGEDGFKRMAGMGSHCKNAWYDYMITESAVGYATIATGSGPDCHGIVADYWYERMDKEIKYCIDDPRYHQAEGPSDVANFSPVSLMSRTFTDELRAKSRFKSKVIGVSMDPVASVMQSGHTANACYWIDPDKGNWTTSTYYMDSLPGWVNEFNGKNYKDIYWEKTWEPLKPLTEYSKSMPDSNRFETGFNGQFTFPYELSLLGRYKKKPDYSVIMPTPFGNTYTKDFAINAIVNEELGKRETTDWINISFDATKYLSDYFTTWSVEVEDMYLRLDEDLAHLLEFLDDYVGLENTLIYLTANHAIAEDPEYLTENRIPSGFFNYHTSISLLRSYLNAIYGTGDWVNLYYANQIYLNRQLIEDSRLSLEDVQNRVASFMIQFTGVSNALPAHVLQRNNFTEGIFNRIQNSFSQKRSGDVIIYLTPGWVEKGSEYRVSLSDFRYEAQVPMIFFGWKIKRSTIPVRVSPKDIVPTIAYFMEMSVPENCSGHVITEMIR